MKCQKCGMLLPDDSGFCQYCGSPIESAIIPDNNGIHPSDNPPPPLHYVEHQQSRSFPVITENSASFYPTFEKETIRSEEDLQGNDSTETNKINHSRAKRNALIAIVALIFVALVATNIIQFLWNQRSQNQLGERNSSVSKLMATNEELSRTDTEQKDTIQTQQATIEELSKKLSEKNTELSQKDAELSRKDEELNIKSTEISDKNNTISSQEATINSQKNKISSLQTKADYFDSISSALKSGNIGYAASNFNCSQSIILVKKGETKKITLTANWSNGGTVTISYSSYAAYVDFDQNNWTYSTTLSIEGNSSGISVVTFSNNVDSKTFKIIIIVE